MVYSELSNHQDYNEKRTTDDWMLEALLIARKYTKIDSLRQVWAVVRMVGRS